MNDNEVIPAIIPRSAAHLLESLDTLRNVTRAFQVDLVDGIYAGVASWPYAPDDTVLEDMAPSLQGLSLEFDLMVRAPRPLLENLKVVGTERVIFHLRDHVDLEGTIDKAPHGAKIGIALRNDDHIEALAPHAARIHFVQCMGIAKIGVQGEPFDERVLGQVRAVRMLYPKFQVSVDGGVSAYTIPLLRDAGATRFVAGSAIFNALDPVRAYDELLRIANA